MTAAIAVTGVRGFIGRHLCSRMPAAGFRCVPIERESLQAGALVPALQGCRAVIHLAGRAHVLHETAASPEDEYHTANVALTLKVADAARRAGVARFVFVSSAGVHGQVSPPEGFDEVSPTRPYDAYTWSKLEAEHRLADDFASTLEIAIVRPPLVYGPGARGNFERLLRGVVAGWPLPVGAIASRRSMIGVRNLGDFLLRAATHPAAPGTAMLVADDGAPTVADFVRAIANAAHRRPRILSVPVPVLRLGLAACGRSSDFARLTQPFVLRDDAARTRLAWSPPHAMSEELEWTCGFVGPDRETE